MLLKRWDPFRELRRIEGEVDRQWRGFGTGRVADAWAVRVDVVRDGDNIVVHALVSGLKPDIIQVSIEDGLLTLKAATEAECKEGKGSYLLHERRNGSFPRPLRLPDTVDAD